MIFNISEVFALQDLFKTEDSFWHSFLSVKTEIFMTSFVQSFSLPSLSFLEYSKM